MLISSDKANIYNICSNPQKARLLAAKKPAVNGSVSFKADQNKKKYENPIKSPFEYLDAMKLTAIAGIAVAGRVLWEIFDVGDIDELFSKQGMKFAVGVSLLIGAAYVALSIPKNLYNRKVEIFEKKKEMDVYARSNSAEQKLYERIDKEAQTTDAERRQELNKDYMTLQMGKNQVPDFVNGYQKGKG